MLSNRCPAENTEYIDLFLWVWVHLFCKISHLYVLKFRVHQVGVQLPQNIASMLSKSYGRKMAKICGAER